MERRPNCFGVRELRFGGWQTAFDGFQAVAHFLDELFEMVEALGDGSLIIRGVLALLFFSGG